MATKRSLRKRHVVGAIIHGQSATADLPHLLHCKMLFLVHAAHEMVGENEDAFPVVVMTVEGEKHEVLHDTEKAKIIRGGIHGLENAIAVFESKNKKDFLTGMSEMPGLDGDAVAIGLGSKEFCMAWIRYMATRSRRTCDSWGIHLVRRLATSEVGDCVWFDGARPNDFYKWQLG